MEPLTRVNATSQLDLQVVTLLESLDERRKDNTYDISKALTQHGASDGSAASGDDMLELNVGGSQSCVRRKHLTSIEGTVLAALFSGRWDGRLIRDADNRIFIDMESEAFEKVRNTLFEGGKAAVDLLITEIANRNYRGLHDFWVRRLLSPVEKPSRKRIRTDEAPSVSAGGVDELRGFCKTVESFLKGYLAEKGKVDEEVQQQKHQYDGLIKEVMAVSAFLKPVSGDDPIRSVEVCGHLIATAESTLTEMGNVALASRFQLWPAAVEDVSEEHIRRLVDYHRRKRHAAAVADECLQGCVAVPLKMGNGPKQDFFNKTAAMYGVDLSGIDLSVETEESAEVVQQGTTTAAAKKAAKKLKDSNEPKRARSAFILFTMDRRDELIAQDPNLYGRVTEVSKICGAEWKSMTDEQRNSYKIKAEKDKARYEREIIEYHKQLAAVDGDPQPGGISRDQVMQKPVVLPKFPLGGKGKATDKSAPPPWARPAAKKVKVRGNIPSIQEALDEAIAGPAPIPSKMGQKASAAKTETQEDMGDDG